jgi:PIN domain nuclease of toxin-antitoxin system
VKLLLDTHALIWWMDRFETLSQTASDSIAEPANELFVSVASIWEIGIKVSLGKLTLSSDYADWMQQTLRNLSPTVVPVRVEFVARQVALPFHHRDPFDRLIIAQALHEGLTIVSRDGAFDDYGVPRLW